MRNILTIEGSQTDLRQELEERLGFETLLADISSRFINLPSDQIDSVIEEAQSRICRCLDIDLSALWQWSVESPRFLTVTHLHSPPEGPLRPDQIDAQKSFPWVLNKVLCGETLVLFGRYAAGGCRSTRSLDVISASSHQWSYPSRSAAVH